MARLRTVHRNWQSEIKDGKFYSLQTRYNYCNGCTGHFAFQKIISSPLLILSGFDDDENIQQITESIRRHAQRKKAAKVL